MHQALFKGIWAPFALSTAIVSPGIQLATVTGGPQRPLQGGQDLLITRQALDFEAGQSRIGDLGMGRWM